ncbi:hypothetical protein RDWZM_006367 [Blomia tropicalis]|uniref:Uncharacterized protein n=1 Tax=Blomia tropicalis TaxID=40697 RepID=A0A9Q0RNH5_BLOTA|nr:hypothetical protein BLOT_008742 [Blomia tropicalis]KAJ6220555.1 hypothetical protein RDWZM_006367 [Blomia tropicalis]
MDYYIPDRVTVNYTTIRFMRGDIADETFDFQETKSIDINANRLMSIKIKEREYPLEYQFKTRKEMVKFITEIERNGYKLGSLVDLLERPPDAKIGEEWHLMEVFKVISL